MILPVYGQTHLYKKIITGDDVTKANIESEHSNSILEGDHPPHMV